MNDRAVASHNFTLEGLVAVVIGGTGVLGGRIAEVFADARAVSVIVGRDERRGERAAMAMRARGQEVELEVCDATQRAALRSLVERIIDRHGRIDVLVNGAGANAGTPFLDITDAEMERIVNVNQFATVRSCQEFGRYFVDRALATGVGASIINVGSLSGLAPLSKVFTYSMTKAAVHNLTRNLAREWGPLGIRCNVLVPGFFPAEQNREILSEERIAAILEHTPSGRFGEPDDLAGAVLLLASDAGRFITGAELVVDGGFNAMTI